VRTVRVAEFLRETSGRGGNPDHGSSPDRRVLVQVVGAAELVPSKVVGVSDARRIGRGVSRRLTRWLRGSHQLRRGLSAAGPAD
jgi:hypothetical protein